jgi:hypothetical protein
MPPFLSCQGEAGADAGRTASGQRAAGSENERGKREAEREKAVAAEGRHGSQTDQD